MVRFRVSVRTAYSVLDLCTYSNPRWHNFKDDLRLAARPVKIVDLMATMCFFNLVLEYEMKEAKVTGHNIIIIYYLYQAN